MRFFRKIRIFLCKHYVSILHNQSEMDKELYDYLWGSSKATWLERIMYSQHIHTNFLKTGIHGFLDVCEEQYMPIKPTLDNYGFLDTDIVTLNGSTIPLPVELSKNSKKLYADFCNATHMQATQFATMAAQIINDSMAYEFSMILAKHKLDGTEQDVKYYEEARRTYTPPSDATLRGICTDAGYLIRKIMFKRGTELPYWISQGSLKDMNTQNARTHDVTIFFSDKRWVLINSISPTNPKYIIKKDELASKRIAHQSPSIEDKVITF